MPDHLHLIIRINQPLPQGKHLGIIIGAFKGGVSRAWWNLDTTVSAASASDSRPPLFEPNYNDHILMRDGQLDNWKRYLRDNPLRYMMRREYPNIFLRSLCVSIGGTRYSAFGNLLLLRQPEKHQVFFHRYTDGVPTENTEYWETDKKHLISAANSGDVLVTTAEEAGAKKVYRRRIIFKPTTDLRTKLNDVALTQLGADILTSADDPDPVPGEGD